jgi:hypothetical protein
LSMTDWKKEEACREQRDYINNLYATKGT